MAARRAEDRAALAHLGARPCWLEFPDTQYGEMPPLDALADALDGTLGQVAADVVAIPLGQFHGDHRLTSAAALWVLSGRGDLTWLAYADAIYRRVPDLLDNRLRELRASGVDIAEAGLSGPASAAKRRAIECYGSQLRALAATWDGGHTDAFEPERYWRLGIGAASLAAPGRGR